MGAVLTLICSDRHGDVRATLACGPFAPIIVEAFEGQLFPYRNRVFRNLQTRFSLVTASIKSKTPLPFDATFEDTAWVEDAFHDALLQSQQLSTTSAGKEAILNGDFARYW